MLFAWALVIAASCPVTVIDVRTNEAWTVRDQLALVTAARGCVRYFPQSPCLKRFIRVEQGRYWAVCGR
jgi:hypothetical protein